jgi:hypothetical protein
MIIENGEQQRDRFAWAGYEQSDQECIFLVKKLFRGEIFENYCPWDLPKM